MINVRAIDIPFLHLSLVILALGIAEVVLVRTLAHDFNQWPASSTGTAQLKYDLPLRINLNTAPEGLEIVSGAFAIATGSIGLIRWVLVVKSWWNEEDEVVAQRERIRRWNPFCIGITSVCGLLTLVSLIYAFVAAYKSSKLQDSDTDSSSQLFTRETWTCQMRLQFPSDADRHWGTMCDSARAGRWLLLPLFIALAALTGVALRDRYTPDKVPRDVELKVFDEDEQSVSEWSVASQCC